MREHIGGDLAEAAPHQFLANLISLGSPHRRHDDQRPAAGPGRIGFAVDALGGLREPGASILRQVIFAELARPAPLQPAVVREPRGRGAHQTFIQPKGSRELNQAAQGDGPAPRHDGIAEQRHDERTAAQRALAAKSGDQIGGGGEGGGCDAEWCGNGVRAFLAISVAFLEVLPL